MTQEFKIGGRTFLAVGVPEAERYCLHETNVGYDKCQWLINGVWHSAEIPNGWYDILFRLSKATEEDFAKVVENYDGLPNFYQDYIKTDYGVCASVSFSTLMEREKLYVKNPYGEKEPERYEGVIVQGVREGCCGNPTKYGSCCGNSTPEPYEYEDCQEREGWFMWAQAQSRVFPDWLIIEVK